MSAVSVEISLLFSFSVGSCISLIGIASPAAVSHSSSSTSRFTRYIGSAVDYQNLGLEYLLVAKSILSFRGLLFMIEQIDFRVLDGLGN